MAGIDDRYLLHNWECLMEWTDIGMIIVVTGLFLYLAYALFNPEKF